MIRQHPSLNTLLDTQHPEDLQFDQLIQMAKAAKSPTTAYHYATKAYEFASLQKDKTQLAIAELLLVDVLIKNGAYLDALNKNIQVLEYFRKENMVAEEANGWRYMAIIHSFLGDHAKQLDYNNKCLALIKTLDQPLEQLKILNNIGDAYFNLGLYDKALEVFEKNLKHPHADTLIQVVSTKNIGKVYFKKKDFDQAKTIFQKVSAMAEKHDMIVFSIASDHFLGRIYAALEKYPLAFEYLERATKNFEKIEFKQKEYKYVLEDILTVLLALGKSEKASLYFKKYTEINNVISEKIKSRSARNVQFKLEINEIEQKRLFLEEQNKTLKEANEKIKIQQEALKVANQELTNFAHMVSHDIKQPVRTINNFTKLLAREVKDHLNDNARDFIDIIDSSTKRITAFVEDILNYATATESKVSSEIVDCNEVLEKIKLNLEFQLKESEGQLIIGELPSLNAHRALMLQVFQNIISNGLKFRRAGVPPIIQINGQETEIEYYFEIRDNGIGIKEEDQACIFKIFKKLNKQTEFEGSGIGLNTVLKILQKYNGSIDLESTFGEGTTFKISIPKVVSNDN